ncbi:hypothetical protein UFOVP699_201 [uncultured Caudovirales phage]|uniref:Uncharacterized protein n=1 Tax=uncultured Caudovirales phage TaxID=2100421 RepID=A0A6J5NQN2_9CAUD|nr:hypothetical protein UFOVP699_201 [uncultured Caudovirales phage]
MNKYIKLFEDYTTVSKSNWEGSKLIVTGSYSPKSGDYDGMHSFQSRKKDGFGGKMNDAVNAALLEFYEKKSMNPAIEKIEVKMDDSAWKVDWKVTISESKDGKAWMGLTSRGGAGKKDGLSGSVERAKRQIEKKKKDLSSEFNEPSLETKEVLDFNWTSQKNPKMHIRQIFIAFTKPNKYPHREKLNMLS